MAKPNIEPITDQTLPDFAIFLEANMPVKRTSNDWIAGLKTTLGADHPNYGFLMRDDGRVVGGIGAFYSNRIIRGQTERFCNITSWCVLDSHRKYSMQLAMSLVGQQGYHFTDFSPTKLVSGVLKFLKFKTLDEGVAVIPNFPLFPWSGRVITDPMKIENQLSGDMAKIWRDHSSIPWLKHLIVGRSTEWCYAIYKPGKFMSASCANFIYASNGELFNKYLNRLGCHLFWQGMMTTHIEKRLLGQLPMLSRVRTGFNPKQFLSQTLEPSDIDYLYSETVALDL